VSKKFESFNTLPNVQPSDAPRFGSGKARVLLIACGALAREVIDLIELNKWSAFDIECLPAKWHNTPQFIVPAIREKLKAGKHRYQKIYVLYGDCGTGGMLDKLLAEEGVERLDGPHCYAFYTGNQQFVKQGDDDMTSFYLTDYIARQFDKLIWAGLGLDKHPELRDEYFRHYTKVIYLAQVKDAALEERAKAAARKLGLTYEYRFTGYGELAAELEKRA
jgi:Protein of unknown function (DUF1638)